MAMMKLHSQLRNPAMDIAGGRGPVLNNSAGMNCGIEPETRVGDSKSSFLDFNYIFQNIGKFVPKVGEPGLPGMIVEEVSTLGFKRLFKRLKICGLLPEGHF